MHNPKLNLDKSTNLEVRTCNVWNLINQTMISPDWGKQEEFLYFFENQNDISLLVELEIGVLREHVFSLLK